MRELSELFRVLKKRFLRGLKRFFRRCYRLGLPTCLFFTGVIIAVLVTLTLLLGRATKRSASASYAYENAAALVTAAPGADSDAAPDAAMTRQTDGVAAQAAPSPAPETAERENVALPAAATPTPTATPDVRLEKGDEKEAVQTLQERLMELGYLAIDEPTQYYGNATKYAVELFQRQHALKQDGIAGFETQQMLFSKEAKPYVMTEGAEGDDIKDFQEKLVELGYLTSSQITGYYGTDTVTAVTKFQRRNHLGKDGKAGEMTLEMINSPDANVSYTRELEIEKEKAEAAERARQASAEGRIDKLIDIAKKQLGKPYVLGAKGPDEFDCSGLVYYCLIRVDVYTRRLNARGFSRTSAWKKIDDFDDVKRGDLLFFNSGSSSTIGHVGIYAGSGEMIDASSANGKVVRRSARSSYWKKHFVCARRPIE